MFRQLARYGVHTLASAAGYQLLNQGPALMIGHFHPAAFVGYYNVPVRLLQIPAAAVDRVGGVASSTSAEMKARREEGSIARLGTYANRYCLALFLPAAVFLAIYGPELVSVWIRKPEYAAHSAALFLPLLLGWTLGIAAQFNSSSILYGIAQHRWFGRGLLAEGLLLTGALWYVVPRYGIAGAAWVGSVLMLADRGLFTPSLLCRYLRIGYFRYMLSIYARPLAAAVPATAFAMWLKARVLAGANLREVLGAAALVAAVYYAVAFFACVEPQHRSLVWGWARERVRAVQAVFA
jgi:O-antigen/teichoic acid export membrane protein